MDWFFDVKFYSGNHVPAKPGPRPDGETPRHRHNVDRRHESDNGKAPYLAFAQEIPPLPD